MKHLEDLVKRRFPTIQNLRIDHLSNQVQPVRYMDGLSEKNEYPPVLYWRVHGRRFAYVLQPSFKVERVTGLFYDRAVTNVDYSAEDEKIWQVLEWSVQGKTEEEINALLGNHD